MRQNERSDREPRGSEAGIGCEEIPQSRPQVRPPTKPRHSRGAAGRKRVARLWMDGECVGRWMSALVKAKCSCQGNGLQPVACFPLASDKTVDGVMAESHVDRVTGAPGSIHGDASRFRAMGLDHDKPKAKRAREMTRRL